jgi:predicted acylesterase/phospholipase RssA
VTAPQEPARASPESAHVETIGVALSGGGVRAALFSAGALAEICRYAAARESRLLVSTVSGSSLLALEIAWSDAKSDLEALKQVEERITAYAYWGRRRWWVLLGIVVVGGFVGYSLWEHRHYSFPATVLGSIPFVAGAVLLVAGFFRTQGVWYRTSWLPIRWRVQGTSIYTAQASEFSRQPGRLLSLDDFVFNVTSMTRGVRESFGYNAKSMAGPVRLFAEASAAFPGVFLPRPLPGEEGLFADGGIHDNTGVSYFSDLQSPPQVVIAVDAGVSSPAPTGVPYAFLSRVLSNSTKVLTWMVGSVIAVTVVGAALGAGWISVVAFLVVIAMVVVWVLTLPMSFLAGLWNDAQWFGRGWPITLRVASDLHLAKFQSEQESAGGVLQVVRLGDASVSSRAKTQLWRHKVEVAHELVAEGQQRARAVLDGLR